MSRYIDADKIIYFTMRQNLNGEIMVSHLVHQEMVDLVPTADVEPVRHGKWLTTDAYPHKVYCSECYKTYAQTHWQVWTDKEKPLPRNYCPNCGAKMDKK